MKLTSKDHCSIIFYSVRNGHAQNELGMRLHRCRAACSKVMHVQYKRWDFATDAGARMVNPP